MKTYYITGLAGFVGNNLLKELEKEKDIRVVALVLPSEMNVSFVNKSFITLIPGNILKKKDVYRFLSTRSDGEKYVIHAAGKVSTLKNGDPLTVKINFEGTKNIVDVINEIGEFKKLVYVSSVDSMPRSTISGDVFEIDSYNPNEVEGVFAKSKALANNYILENCKIKSTIVLPSSIMGPNDPHNAPINDILKRFMNNRLQTITKGGYNIVDVRDVAKGILRALEKGRNRESYLLTGEFISLKDLIDLAADILETKTITKEVSPLFIKMSSPFISLNAKIRGKNPLFTRFSMNYLLQNSHFNNTKAIKELGYKTRPIQETMKDTIEWLKDDINKDIQNK